MILCYWSSVIYALEVALRMIIPHISDDAKITDRYFYHKLVSWFVLFVVVVFLLLLSVLSTTEAGGLIVQCMRTTNVNSPV